MLIRNDFFIISGTIAAGKSSVINMLGERNVGGVLGDIGKNLAKQTIAAGGAPPWENRTAFEMKLLKHLINIMEHKPRTRGNIYFIERAIPDSIAFINYQGLNVPQILLDAANEYRCNNIVFFLPPCLMAFNARKPTHWTFEETKRFSSILRETYLSLNYDVIDILCSAIDKRVNLIARWTWNL